MSENAAPAPLCERLSAIANVWDCTSAEAKWADAQEPPEISWLELRGMARLFAEAAAEIRRLQATLDTVTQERDANKRAELHWMSVLDALVALRPRIKAETLCCCRVGHDDGCAKHALLALIAQVGL